MALTPNSELTLAEKRAQRDAAEQDVLLREVDDAVRQGDFEDAMRKWGRPGLVALVLLLAAFGGYLFWQHRQDAAREADSEALIGALDAYGAGDLAGADKKAAALSGTAAGGVGVSAQLLRAGIAAQQNRTAEAIKIYTAVAADGDAPQAMRDLAKLREITLRYDGMDKNQVVAAVKPLAVPGKPYFASAGELLAHAYLDLGKRAEAGALFAQISKDKDAPESLRTRARNMAGILGVDAIEDVDKLLRDQTAPDTAAAAQP